MSAGPGSISEQMQQLLSGLVALLCAFRSSTHVQLTANWVGNCNGYFFKISASPHCRICDYSELLELAAN